MCLLSFVYNQNTVTSVNEILSLKKFAVCSVNEILSLIKFAVCKAGDWDYLQRGCQNISSIIGIIVS